MLSSFGPVQCGLGAGRLCTLPLTLTPTLTLTLTLTLILTLTLTLILTLILTLTSRQALQGHTVPEDELAQLNKPPEAYPHHT